MKSAIDDEIVTGNTYDKYSSTNPIERRIMAGFLRTLDAALPSAAPTDVLEVGVGEGEISERVSRRYPDAAVAGIDLPDPALAERWAGRPVAACFADIARLPFDADRFDLVLAVEVLEHVPDPAAALREIVRVGRDRVVLSVPREPIWRAANLARGKYVRDLGNTPGHVQHWSTRSFRRLVSEHLDVIAVHRPFPWTLIEARVAPTATVS